MKKKGFTLIELLAVIVILAVIALIAVPTITKVIQNAKEESAIRSAELYSTALIEQIQSEMMSDENLEISSCTVNNDGTATCSSKTLKVVTEETTPTSGTINISNGKISNNSTLKINGYCLKYSNSKWSITECDSSSSSEQLSGNACYSTAVITNATKVAEYNAALGKNETQYLQITGYKCGDKMLSFDDDNWYRPGTATFDNSGTETTISIPEKLPIKSIKSYTYNQSKCVNYMKTYSGSDDEESLKQMCDNDIGSMTNEEIDEALENNPATASMLEYYFDIEYEETGEEAYVVSIAEHAFGGISYGNVGVKSVTIPATILEMDYSSFWRNEIEDITIKGKCMQSEDFEIGNAAFAEGYDMGDIKWDTSCNYTITYDGVTPNGTYPTTANARDSITIDFQNKNIDYFEITLFQYSQYDEEDDDYQNYYSTTENYTYENGVLTIPNVSGNLTIKESIPEIDRFNTKIKSLVSGNNVTIDATIDETVKSIKFYTRGNLPSGYTKQTLENLPSTVLAQRENTWAKIAGSEVKAYYDENNNSIYVVSNTKLLTNSTSSMFSYFTKLENIDFENLIISDAYNLDSMFKGCSSLKTLDLSNLDTSNVKFMGEMFRGCSALTTIKVSNKWSTAAVTSSSWMFVDCTSLVGGNGTTYNSSYLDKTYARIDTADTPGYFTYKASTN